jgi:hypothetical protein
LFLVGCRQVPGFRESDIARRAQRCVTDHKEPPFCLVWTA